MKRKIFLEKIYKLQYKSYLELNTHLRLADTDDLGYISVHPGVIELGNYSINNRKCRFLHNKKFNNKIIDFFADNM